MKAIWTIALMGLSVTADAAEQAGHQMPGMAQPAPQAAVAECAQAQPQAMQTIEAANTRLETARQSNTPRMMRAAMDDLQAALGSLRAQLAACGKLQTMAPADPHAGHAMPDTMQAPPGTPMMQPGSTTPAPGAPMDHSKMPMGGAAAGKPAPATGTKPAAPAAEDPHAGHTMSKPAPKAEPAKPESSRPAQPSGAAADPHAGHTTSKPPAAAGLAKPAAPMDHSKMQMGGQGKEGKAMDPVTGLMVDPTTAPKATHQGQTYYFSSEQSRKEFLANPSKFAKKPKG